MSNLKRAASKENGEPVIVQCPLCQTKFAIGATEIAQHESPRFHCSRCDNVFALEEQGYLASPQYRAADASGASPIQTARQPGNQPAERPAPSAAPAAAEPQIRTRPSYPYGGSGGSEHPAERQLDLPDRSGEPEPRTSVARGLEIPPALDRSFHGSAPHEMAPSSGDDEEQLEFGFFDRIAQREEVRLPGRPSQEVARVELPIISHPIAASAAETPPAIEAPHKPEPLPDLFGPEETPAPSGYSASGYGALRSERAAVPQSRRVAQAPGRWAGVRLILTPILSFLAVLLALSFYFQRNPQSALLFGSSLFSSSALPPPEGVQIASTRFKLVTLDNGDTLPVILGAVTNQSGSDFREVLVEGLAFDASGKNIVARVRGEAGSELSRARLKGLGFDAIKRLSAQRDKRASFKNGEELSFALPILEGDMSKARYFLARVYSVR